MITRSFFTLWILLLLLLPGRLSAAEQRVQLDDGSSVKVFMFYPKEGEGPWPLCVFMAGGTANEYVARAQFYFGYELAKRGWAIAVPVSPDETPFFGENAAKIPQVIERLHQSPQILPGKTLLVGVSNGGSSAIEIAARDPEDFLGVVAVPGILKDKSVVKDLNGLPIYIRIGDKDAFRWHEQLHEIAKVLTDAGAKVNAALQPGARHVFAIDWEQLQPWLDSLERPSLDQEVTPAPAAPATPLEERSATPEN